MQIFISWSGQRSATLANALHAWLPDVLPGSEPWLSNEDIAPGTRWTEKIASRLANSQFGIICVTPENAAAPWLLFEAGAISKALSDAYVCPILLDMQSNPLEGPLSQFQSVEFTQRGIAKLVQQMNQLQDVTIPEERMSRSIDVWWRELDRRVTEAKVIEGVPWRIELESLGTRMRKGLAALQHHGEFMENKYFRRIVLDSCSGHAQTINALCPDGDMISVPYDTYPRYLITLLREYKVTVKALAVLDVEEEFWRGRVGQEVLRNTHKNSTRVFVFQTPKQMEETIHVLRQHSKRYNVCVISYSNLAREFNGFTYDFSVIGDIGKRVLAKYEDSPTDKLLRVITFHTRKDEISIHEDTINSVIQSSIVASLYADDNELIEATFRTPEAKKKIIQKQIEMSAYIDLPYYDEHEEKHAYYADMVSRMISLSEQHRLSKENRVRILEFGAGTGLFTKHILDRHNVDVTAIELDWACFVMLRHTINRMKQDAFSHGSKGVAMNHDSRRYDPEGTFDFVFSCFADHHIKPYDKLEYFSNVKRNLATGGRFIVGDEFLREYSSSDVEDRRLALRTYHNHIIDVAKKHGHSDLVDLEMAALKSGLEEVGDFKLSCQEYEKLLSAAGLSFVKEKIGPLDDDSIGGIYVYTISS